MRIPDGTTSNHPGNCSQDIQQAFDAFMAHLREVRADDLDSYERQLHQRLSEIIRRAEKLFGDCRCLKEVVFKAVSPFLDKSRLQWIQRHKPMGYAGDFQAIDWIYTRKLDEVPEAAVWDELYHRQAASRAVRNRKQYLVELFSGLCRAHGGGIRMLNLASGSCRDVADALKASGDVASGAYIHCVHQDERAVVHGMDLVSTCDRSIRFHWQVASPALIRLQGGYDLVWSGGLFDYLTDRQATSLLSRMWSSTTNGGRCVAGNFHPRNPTRLYMEWLYDWHLVHRDEDDLLRLAQSAGIPAGSCRIEFEPLGVCAFLVSEKS